MTARPQHASPRGKVVEWTPDRAEEAALEAGLPPLGPLQWKVVALYREELASTGVRPALERLASLCHLSTADLGALFPGDTGRLLARIAGRPVDPGRVVPPIRS